MVSAHYQASLLCVQQDVLNYSNVCKVVSLLVSCLQPYIIGLIAKDQTLPQWRTVFYLTCGVLIVTNAVFVIFGSGEVQPWNDTRTVKDSEEESDKSETTSIEDKKAKQKNIA